MSQSRVRALHQARVVVVIRAHPDTEVLEMDKKGTRRGETHGWADG